MKIEIKRNYFSSTCVLGKLYIDNAYFCDTLEPSIEGNHPCIPVGSYQLSLIWSPKFKRYMFRLEVFGRSGILLHTGNYPSHTQGCILVGVQNNAIVTEAVYNSRDTFRRLYNKLISSVSNTPASNIIITIKNA